MLCRTVDLPDTCIVVLVDMSLDDNVRSALIAKDDLDPPLVCTMLHKLGNVLGSTEELKQIYTTST